MATMATRDKIIISKRDLKTILRHVVREELERFAARAEKDWEIEEGSVLWEDLLELKKEFREGRLKLYSRKEDLRE